LACENFYEQGKLPLYFLIYLWLWFKIVYKIKYIYWKQSVRNQVNICEHSYNKIIYAMQCLEMKESENTKERRKIYSARVSSDEYNFVLFKYQINFVKLFIISKTLWISWHSTVGRFHTVDKNIFTFFLVFVVFLKVQRDFTPKIS
jgi:hypothetical protein